MATEEDIVKLKLDQERRAYQAQLQAEQEQNESETPEPKKMGLVFFLAALFFSVIGDLIDFFTGGTIGWLIGLLIDGILALMFGMSSSGRKQFKKMAIGFVGESIPFVAMLPFRTITTIWSFVSSRSKIIRKVGDRLKHQVRKVEPALNAINVAQKPKIATPGTPGKSQENKASSSHIQQGMATPDPMESERRKREENYRKGMGTDETSQKNIKETTDWAFKGQQSIRQGDKIDQIEMAQKRKKEIEYRRSMGMKETADNEQDKMAA